MAQHDVEAKSYIARDPADVSLRGGDLWHATWHVISLDCKYMSHIKYHERGASNSKKWAINHTIRDHLCENDNNKKKTRKNPETA